MVAETQPTLIAWSELTQAIGTKLGPSTWHVVDQARVSGFADATEDHQWIHLDANRAAETPFGGTVAHGYLTLALAPALLDEIVTVENSGMVINYGANKVRFPAPLRVGSRVRMSAELASATESKDGSVQVLFALTFEGEGSEKPCCIAEIIFRYYPQEAPDASGSRPEPQTKPVASALLPDPAVAPWSPIPYPVGVTAAWLRWLGGTYTVYAETAALTARFWTEAFAGGHSQASRAITTDRAR